jgi:hypothetical protein
MVCVVAVVGAASSCADALATSGRLQWFGGPVVHSSRPYLIFWTPSGESVAPSSQALMKRYFTDVAADSGKSSNMFGVLRQYYDRTGFADYRQTFDSTHQVIVDTQPYPHEDPVGCPDVSVTYPTCISDRQIQSELQRLIAAEQLPTAGPIKTATRPAGSVPARLSANAAIYFVVLPADVSVCFVGLECSDKDMSGYHESFTDAEGNEVLYAPITTHCCALGPPPPGIAGPCQLGGTFVPQEPNGDAADCVINYLTHEDSETITDPIPGTPHTGWAQNRFVQGEVADECELRGPFDPEGEFNPAAYEPTLGGSETAGTLYTQLIDDHPYYTQSLWSNGTHNCEMRPSGGRIVARFIVTQGASRTGNTVIFDPAASTSKIPLSSATWNFGDGSRPAFRYPSAVFRGSAVLIRAQHRYREAGRYTVTLTLVDNRGNLETTTRRVTVHTR